MFLEPKLINQTINRINVVNSGSLDEEVLRVDPYDDLEERDAATGNANQSTEVHNKSAVHAKLFLIRKRHGLSTSSVMSETQEHYV